jgi:ribulose 1,5-bisphosphate carboxylase large subunit-like protein
MLLTTVVGIPLKAAAETYPELKEALEKWLDPFGKGIGL